MATVEQGTSSVASAQGATVDSQLASMFASSVSSINTPESLGWALVNYVLSEGVGKGTVNGDRIEVPCMVSVSIPPAPLDAGGDLVSEICITVLGHQLVCLQYHAHSVEPTHH